MLCLYQENDFPKFQNLWKEIGPAPRIFSLLREIMDFTMGQNLKKIEIDFLGWKIYQYCSGVYQKMRNSNTWGGGMFSKKSSFCLFIYEKIMIFEITMELHYNLKNLKSWFSHENI